MDRGAWQATVHGVVELDTTEQLTHSCHIYIYIFIYIYTHTHIHMTKVQNIAHNKKTTPELNCYFI